MKKTVTKKEIFKALLHIEYICRALPKNNDEPFDNGFKCCAELIIKQLEYLEKGFYR